MFVSLQLSRTAAKPFRLRPMDRSGELWDVVGRTEAPRRAVVLAADERGTYRCGDEAASPDSHTNSTGDRRLRRAIDEVAAVLDNDACAPGEAGGFRHRVRLLERLQGIATAGLADTVRALADAGGVEADGASSTTEWIKATTHRSGRDAARIARLATDLDDLPATRAALTQGRLSDEAADAVVQAARDGRLGPPEHAETELLPVATTSSPEDLRAQIRTRQQAADPAAMLRDENRQHARRSTRLWRKATGMWGVSGDLTDEVGTAFRIALDAFDVLDPGPRADPASDDHATNGRGSGDHRRPDQRLHDALAAVTHAVLDRGLAPATGGVVRPHLSIIVDVNTLDTDLTAPTSPDPDDPTAAPAPTDARWADLAPGETTWGGQLSPQAVRRLCCDASISRIVMAGPSQVLDVGRATREWSQPQRRAINARDRHCRGPNCSRPIAWTAIHHVRWWQRDHGPTAIDNGLALCHQCHRLVHDHGWTLDLDPTTAHASWTSPDGTATTTRPKRGPSPSQPVRRTGRDHGRGDHAEVARPTIDTDSSTLFPLATTSGGPPRP